jgi:carbonic anhydrase
MERIIEGVARFQTEVFPGLQPHYRQLASQQRPEALFITCADSRVVPDVITQASPGDLFICRNAGNIVPSYGETHGGVSATIEYAVTALGIQHIIVCGHSDCGAMKGILHPEKLGDMPAVASWLRYGDVARRVVRETQGELPDPELLPRVTEQNVIAQLANLRTHPAVAARLAQGSLQLHGWMYHIGTGLVESYDPLEQRFIPLRSTDNNTPSPEPTFSRVA